MVGILGLWCKGKNVPLPGHHVDEDITQEVGYATIGVRALYVGKRVGESCGWRPRHSEY